VSALRLQHSANFMLHCSGLELGDYGPEVCLMCLCPASFFHFRPMFDAPATCFHRPISGWLEAKASDITPAPA
jgi:hypothetical protein